MDFGKIYIAYIAWQDGGKNGGKTRPVLVIKRFDDKVLIYKITSQYASKSPQIRANYYTIIDWQQAGLRKQSYIDTNSFNALPFAVFDKMQPIGKLSAVDENGLLAFIASKPHAEQHTS
ncbi:hypothetical protein FACS1894103_7460 [Campylobacterota bacterium]|nr:hypothetical protein FACS1894103_7460 [Campylobacterota bacterium]